MSITKPFTFVAGTKARANEVNQNFDVLYSQVNSNISAINTNANDIDTLDNNKANINGSSSQRFACADPMSPSDAVNKQTMLGQLSPTIDYIGGLTIAKDSGSPNNTIIVDSGSCYDSTKKVVLSLANSTSKKNATQAASTTYYVYIVGNSTGSSTDIIISPSFINPMLPSGYTLYRLIGYYTTNGNGNIHFIDNYSNSFNINNILPDYDKEISYNSSAYTVPGYGWCWCWGNGSDHQRYIYINGHPVDTWCGYSGGYAVIGGSTFIVKTGDVLTTNAGNAVGRFYPMKGM